MPPFTMPGNALYRAGNCTVACKPPGIRKLCNPRPSGFACPVQPTTRIQQRFDRIDQFAPKSFTGLQTA